MWKKGLRFGKMRESKERLGTNLFLFNPALRFALLKIREECTILGSVSLLDLGGEASFLPDFVKRQNVVHTETRSKIEVLSAAVLSTARVACDEVVDEFLKENNIVANHKMTFMERASLRSECRHLTRFLRLVDIMVADFLRTMVIEALQSLVVAVEPPTGKDLEAVVCEDTYLDDLVVEKKKAQAAASKSAKKQSLIDQGDVKHLPLFRVTVKFDIQEPEVEEQFSDEEGEGVEEVKEGGEKSEDEEDVKQPQQTILMTMTPNLDQLNTSIDNIIADTLDVVRSLEKVFTSADAEMYVMPADGGEEEENGGGNEGGGDMVDFAAAIRSSQAFLHAKELVNQHLLQAFSAMKKYIQVFESPIQTSLQNEKSANEVSSRFESGEASGFQSAIQEYNGQVELFSAVPKYAVVGVMLVDSENLKEMMLPSPLACLKALQSFLPQLVLSKAQELLDEVGGMNPIIAGDPPTVEAYMLKKKTKDKANLEMENFKSRMAYSRGLVGVMEDNSWPIQDNVKALMRMLKDSIAQLDVNVQLAEGKEEEEVKKFSAQVTEDCPKLVKSAQLLREELDKSMLSNPESSEEKVLKFLNKQDADFKKMREKKEKLQDYQGILKLPVEEFEVLDEVGADLALKLRLWKDKADWTKLRASMLATGISTIDVGTMEKELTKYNRTVFLASKGLPNNDVVPFLKESIDELNPVLPVVVDLRNPALKDRHWDMLTELLGIDMQKEENFTLFDLIDKKVSLKQEEISTIATAAQQESILEEMMAKVTGMWSDTEFNVVPYKDVKDLYILGDTSEIIANLDDSLVTINTVLGSRYVAGIRNFVDLWRSKLMHFQETLDEWLTCQKNWMYLETIFSSADIIRQLPGPAKTFQTVDKSWKVIMKATNDEPNAIKAGTSDKSRKDLFKSHNANLDQIQKDLEDYLETKRMAFPRFYFLSNDELLEILSQAKEPRAVQPHLRKCFDNLIKLEFGAEEGSIDVLAMFSGEGEKVEFGRNLKARGNVEEWLTGVEKKMKESLYGCMKAGLADYDCRPRDEWILNQHPGQVVATVAQMTWARDTEAALSDETNVVTKMNEWSTSYKDELQKLIIKIRGNLKKLERLIIVALVTTDVHARDIIEELIERKVANTFDFLWQQQLRYYWTSEVDDCQIKHSDATVPYGYEYMGATSRLVITPLTDRCWLTLTGSYALKLGGAPAGPAGTGKTESSKDLAKAMGIQCVVFNCSDQIDYKMMGKLFRGLAQGGSWICLDEFNRIDIEVLSVIAQQLLVLREGRITGKKIINFMGITIPLVDHHVIITMNPGYAGRTELPDNLQVCFRPVSMMVPNYALIAEIMLFAEGFGDAKNLSRKMCKLYILCSEQLSQQPHYDYGLRAVKSVLVMAGGLKRANPDLVEDLVLIRALRDSNVPKFLADDLPLFAAIVQDLFPGIDIPPNDYGELQVALEEEIDRAGLQKVPKFIGKVIQMFDIFNIRFGATIVGPAGAGKSSCYRILAKLMTNMREQRNSSDPIFQKVRFTILNPKCITMGELYGEFSPLTQEWHDGLASSIMRQFVAEESDEKRWTIFDGPIDALWIENMNTVLDDNMTLCLANGQRIKLKVEMKCLFEVMDLAVASPATVSRIGVVYMTPSDLGWRPYVTSWQQRAFLAEGSLFPAWVVPRLDQLFDAVVGEGMKHQRRYGTEPVETVDIQLIISLCTLFEVLFHPDRKVKLDLPEEALKLLLDKIFYFSYVWSIGASTEDSFWPAFDERARELFEVVAPNLGLPATGMGFDWFVDVENNRFKDWSEVVPEFQYDGEVPYFSLMVPTMDTCRFSFIMKNLIIADKPCFITGVTGTGKTVAVENLLNSLQPMPYEQEGGMGVMPVFMNFSAQSLSKVTQSTIESKLEKKRKNLLGAPAGRKVVVFVDDVNMPFVEEYGAQAPIELLRQFLDHKGFYDREKLFWKDITDMLLFTGAAPPGGGRAAVTPRFVRHFNVLCVPPASEQALALIFESILGGFLAKFEPEVQKMCKGVVGATIDVYNKISLELLPTPSKFHYTFNLRDISKVFQGLLMIRPRKCGEAEVFGRLWIHECQRIFYDRMINEEDQKWFLKQMAELSQRFLGQSVDEEALSTKPITFADFMKPDAEIRFYEEVRDSNKLVAVLDDLLDTYNGTFPTQMNLVFFLDALMHCVRISRILRQPRGNAMLIGVGGSGKQSLTRMASFVGGMTCKSIEIVRGYGMVEFREDMKNFMIKAGVVGEQTVFLFTDSQIVDETMLEDLNNVLNTGEIPNLFPQDETDKIVSDMIPICKEAGIPETRDNCLAHFVSRVRDRLHIVLGMSPVGDSLRIRCRQFPSLINCTTIDWFHGWPEAALQSVAERFLSDLELPTEDVRAGVVKMCGFVHRSIEKQSVRFYNELRRHVYTTPKSYLDLITLYISMLSGLQNNVEVKCQRMKVGVKKLDETNALVEGLQQELVALAPVLQQKTIETNELLDKVAIDSADAAIVAEKVGKEEAIVGKQAAETKLVADDAQKDLDRALPALESAVKALKSLTKSDITEVKSFTNPPNAVRIVMEAVCVMLGEKEGWDVAKKLLGKSDFMDQLQNYDKDNIAEAKLKKLRKNYIPLDEFQPENVQKVSKAGLGLCLWCRAMDVYADVAKTVGPKRAKLEEMNQLLAAANADLAVKQSQLKEVQDKVASLQELCDVTVAQKNQLQADSDQTANRLVRAEKLTSGLNSEGARWKESIVSLTQEKIDLIGDCFLSCACVSYYGGFTGVYREDLITQWLALAAEVKIPASRTFSLSNTIGDPVLVREWQNQGLPTDQVSVNNGILVDRCRRWPLMIDPQQQANKWLRKKEESNNLQITTMRDANLLRTLENCIRVGRPLLIEDLGEHMEPALEPVLQKATFKNGTRLLIRLGDSDVDYDLNFKLYMTTKLPNPHYLPEVCIKVTLINFTVTFDGLESQLLGDVVAIERPDIEEKKVQLLLQMAEDKRVLSELEAKILQMLSESEGNILDDEVLINTLAESKVTATAIQDRVAEAEVTEQEINEARGRYTGVATRGSIVYFVIADLAGIDPMYQYSLSYYSSLFNKCIVEAEASAALDQRIENIINNISLTIYQNICRGLFEKDKLLFSSSICFQILRHRQEIHDLEWNIFLRGPGALDRSFQQDNPFPEDIAAPMWDLLYALELTLEYSAPVVEEAKVEGEEDKEVEAPEHPPHAFSHLTPFAGLCESITKDYKGSWGKWIESSDVMTEPLPEPFSNTQINEFQRLLLVKALCEYKLQGSIASFVGSKIGQKFAESPNASMADIYKDLDNKTPCIFILSSGADPTATLLRFAKKMGYGDRLHIVSLGQGQGVVAQKLIENGMKTGDWVVLQNCMLAKSWMPELDRIIFELQARVTEENNGVVNGTPVHPDFRLYLTSSPADYFPVSVLQNGVKMTNEPPKGFRANLQGSFASLVKEEDYENCSKPREWKKILSGLAFFHANVQERRKFGPLGWNIRYAFDETDLETSIAVLRRFLEEQDNMPWDALNYISGHINYGGRVTDDWDRRCLMSILSIYVLPEILVDGYKFSESGTYFAPPESDLASVNAYFDSLPSVDSPEVFGMHENANVTFNTNESLTMMATLLSMQPRSSGGGAGKSSDEVVVDLADLYELECPENLNEEDAGPTTFIIQPNGLLPSIAICLTQEMVKFNRLLNKMRQSLCDIKRAIRGMIVMSSDLDSMYTSFLNNQLPSIWERVSFASLKTLGSWVKDLVFRVRFVASWIVNGQPAAFPLPVFFFPQGFMTASLQTFARDHMEAIDNLSFEFEVLKTPPDDIKEGPADGVIVFGLFLEGARWDHDTWMLTDSLPGRMYDLLPAVHMKPAVAHKQAPSTYACPVYKTAVRKGVLSTTGLSTNFVVPVELPTDKDEQKWILAGVAALCNLTD